MTLITQTSASSHAETVAKLTAAIEGRGINVFATVDHAGAARAAGLALDPELVVVFGNPQAGTQLMVDDARVGLDLPLRILVYERDGDVRLAYHDPLDLADAYGLAAHAGVLEQMAGLMVQLVAEAVR
jgi:uncharacterized protein (DUF302 family)